MANDITLPKTNNAIFLKKIKTKKDISGKDVCDGYLIDADEKTARSVIASLGQKNFKGKVGVSGRDGDFNRRALETLEINYLVSPELGQRKDTLKQRDSGMNHVLGKLARKKGVVIVIDFNSISKLKGKEKALRLARVIQNVKICRRAKCGIEIWGCEDKKALQSFGFSLGMSSEQVSKAI